MTFAVTAVDLSRKSFQNDFKRLPDDVRAEAAKRIAEIPDDVRAGRLRFHKLSGYRPGVYSIDVTSGKGKRYKATFELKGSIAEFLRVGTHKDIDRAPR